jgi:hypothetical protein
MHCDGVALADAINERDYDLASFRLLLACLWKSIRYAYARSKCGVFLTIGTGFSFANPIVLVDVSRSRVQIRMASFAVRD